MRNERPGVPSRPRQPKDSTRRALSAPFVNFVDKLVVALAAAILCAAAVVARAEPAPDDFFIFVANDRVAEVKAMLANGVDPDSVDKNGDPAIVIAARGGNAATLDILLAT